MEMKSYEQDKFDDIYYNDYARGGFWKYSWERHRGEQEKKLRWIEMHFMKFKKYPIKSILFGACAHGFEIREARRRGFRARGVDMSDYALEHVDETVKDYVSKADLRDLPFRDDSFDLVCVFDAFHTVDIDSRHLAYKEINRVAKYGLVLRMRVLPAREEEPHYDGTLDGTAAFRETLASTIVKIEDLEKFKMFQLEVGNRYVAWYAFGLEKFFPIKFSQVYELGLPNFYEKLKNKNKD